MCVNRKHKLPLLNLRIHCAQNILPKSIGGGAGGGAGRMAVLRMGRPDGCLLSHEMGNISSERLSLADA